MNKLHTWIGISMIMLGSLVAAALRVEAFPRNLDWKQMQTEHLTIVFTEPQRAVAQEVARFADAVYTELAEIFAYQKDARTYVILSDYPANFKHEEFFPLEDAIILYPEEPGTGETFPGVNQANRLKEQFTAQAVQVLRHQMDSFVRSIVSKVFPDLGFSGWMEEGLSAYVAMLIQDQRHIPTYLDLFMRTEMLESLALQLEQEGSWGQRAWPGNLSPALYGYSFIHYLGGVYGTKRLSELNQTQNTTIPRPFASDPFEKIYGKPLKVLEQEWEAALQEAYQRQIQEIRVQPLTLSTPLTEHGYFTNSPVFAPDGESIYYVKHTLEDVPTLIQYQLTDQTSVPVLEGYFSGDFSASSDGERLYFCQTDRYHTWYDVSDLYVFDLTKDTVTRLTDGERAFDPAIAPDEKTLVYTASQGGRMLLIKMDLANGARAVLIDADDNLRIRHPSFSQDGKQIAVQITKTNGSQDIYVLNHDGTGLTPILSKNTSVETAPVWGMNDAYLFFSSDRTGVPNIFAYAPGNKALFQVTNVLTGAFDPAVSPNGKYLVFERYARAGLDLHSTELTGREWTTVIAPQSPARIAAEPGITLTPVVLPTPVIAALDLPETSYRPLSTFSVNAYPLPGGDEEGTQAGLKLYGNDLLGQHAYALTLLYGFESQRLAFEAEYLNRQFYPDIRLFGYDYAYPYAKLLWNNRGEEVDYWERRQGFGGELQFPFYQTRRTTVTLTTGFEYTKLRQLTALQDLLPPDPDEGILSDVAASVVFDNTFQPRFAFFPKIGDRLLLQYRRYDEIFGSDFNINAVVAASTSYIPLPVGQDHLLVLKAAGGLSDGDTLAQGLFQLGGYGFKLQNDTSSVPQFVLRGYEGNLFSGDRVLLGTAEYRAPLAFPQRTIWHGRIFVDSISGALFVEGGDAWTSDVRERELKYSAGGEVVLHLGWKDGRRPMNIGIGVANGFDEERGETQVYGYLTLLD